MTTTAIPKRSVLILTLIAFLFLASPTITSLSGKVATTSSYLFGPNQNYALEGSYNWAGYALPATTGSVSAVSGSWNMPSISCNSKATSAQFAAFWVGIDGLTSKTVEQTGTLAYCPKGSNGPAQITAWYEIYPLESVILISSVKVSSGDTIQGSVAYSSSSNQFTMSIKDVSTGRSFSASQKEAMATRSSAEWIAETPEICNNAGTKCHLALLANFGTVKFGVNGQDMVTVGGLSKPIGYFAASLVEIEMVKLSNQYVTMAIPSAIGSDKSSFSMVWKSAGP
jgi:hypothetical protein